MIDREEVTLPSQHRPGRVWPTTAGAVVACLALSAAVGATASPVYEALSTTLGVTEGVWSGVLFSSYLLLLGVAVVMWRPRAFGLQLGSVSSQWKTIFAVTAVFVALVAIVLSQMPATPYSNSDWVFEVIAVPVSEELFFRGAVLTGLIWWLRKAHPRRRATSLAVLIGGVAFGLAHLSNLVIAPASFVVPQAMFAIVLGIAAGYLRVRTDSIYPAVFLHAAVNLVVVMM
jgi:membrane protease YdiL (CAAX protease family)